jgi:hypothetical protein
MSMDNIMNPINSNDTEDKSKRQFTPGLIRKAGKPSLFFYRPPWISHRFRSSRVTSGEKPSVIMPVPDKWDGKEYDPAQIRERPMPGRNVSRAIAGTDSNQA